MPATRSQTKVIHLIAGADEFSVKEAAAELAKQLAPKGAGEFGLEIIEGTAGNQDEALKILGRLHEALNTVGFFGAEKLVWLKSTNLLADERGVTAEAVKDALADLGESLKRGLPEGVTLLISAIGCDRRKSLYKTLEKVADVQFFEAVDPTKEAGAEEIESFIRDTLRRDKKTFSDDGFDAFRELVEPNFRAMAGELEKLVLYTGKRSEITGVDVRAICSASRQAIIWELTDRLGARNLPGAIATLDNLLLAGEEPIGIVMMLVSQFRLTLLMRDLMARKIIAARDGNGGNFEFVKAFGQLPADAIAHFPLTKDGKPPSPWRLYKCALAARNFTTTELIRAMELLLDANRRLVSTQLDDQLVLEEALTKIVRK